MQEHTHLFLGTAVLVQKKDGDIKLPSHKIITRNSIYACHTPVPAKTFLTDTDKKAKHKPDLYLNLYTKQSHLIPQITIIQLQIMKLLAVYQMNVRVNLEVRLRMY